MEAVVVLLLKAAENWDGWPATKTTWVFIQNMRAQQGSTMRRGGLQGPLSRDGELGKPNGQDQSDQGRL